VQPISERSPAAGSVRREVLMMNGLLSRLHQLRRGQSNMREKDRSERNVRFGGKRLCGDR
jgi:hypothetical protein